MAEVAKELHKLWENEVLIRDRLRETKAMCKLEKPQLVGVPCMANVAINYKILIILADYWCPLQKEPKSCPVPFIRAQAGMIAHPVAVASQGL